MYWRLNDIPELHGVPATRRRRLWSEAVARSFRVRHLLVRLASGMAGGAVLAGAGYLLWPVPVVWLMLGLLGIFCAGVTFEFNVVQPRARRWLRGHAGELDRHRLA